MIDAVLAFALQRASACVVNDEFSDEIQGEQRQQREYRQRDEIPASSALVLLIGRIEFFRRLQQRFAVVEDIARGLLRVHQALHIPENIAHATAVFGKSCFEFAELRLGFGIGSGGDAQRIVAEQKCYFGIDHVTREHRIRILRDTLGQHDELARGRVPASTRAGLQRQRSNLVGKIEQGGVVVVNRAHRLAEGDKVALLVDHEICIALGFFPFRDHRIECGSRIVRSGRQIDLAACAAGSEQFYQLCEFVAALAQLLECDRITL